MILPKTVSSQVKFLGDIPVSISTPKPHTLTIQGQVLKYSVPQPPQVRKNPAKPGKRKPIKEFSRQSRGRLITRIASVDYNHLAQNDVSQLFLTLTSPPEYWDNETGSYGALRSLMRWLRDLPGYQAHIFKKEYGKNGMLHYHGWLLGVEWIPANELRSRWSEYLTGDPEASIRVQVEKVKNPQQAGRYLAKYLSKPQGIPDAQSALTLSKAHNGTEGEKEKEKTPIQGEKSKLYGEYTGSRWWYIGGKLPLCEVIQLKGGEYCEYTEEAIRHIATRYRRAFRKWYLKKQQAKIVAAFDKGKIRVHTKSLHKTDVSTLYQQAKEYLRGTIRAKYRQNRHKMGWLYGVTGFTFYLPTECIGDLMLNIIQEYCSTECST